MSGEPAAAGDPSDQPRPGTFERWTYGGVRIGHGGKKLAAWVDGTGRQLLFAPDKGTAPVVGSDYEVRVDREGEGVSLYVSPRPRYVGRCEDDERRASLMATDRAVRAEIDTERRQKQDKADDPLMNLCDEIAAVLAKVPTPQRSMAVYAVYERIARKAWR